MPSDRHRPLPVAPRPFEGEVLGGWIGRIASRYKLPVHIFERTYGLNFEMAGGRGWLLLDGLSSETLRRLSALMRMDEKDIQAIPAPPHWIGSRKTLRYCPRCVFVNEEDVTAPIWRREWLDQELTHCSADHSPFRSVPAIAALACRNLDQLIALVGRYERLLRAEAYEKRR